MLLSITAENVKTTKTEQETNNYDYDSSQMWLVVHIQDWMIEVSEGQVIGKGSKDDIEWRIIYFLRIQI